VIPAEGRREPHGAAQRCRGSDHQARLTETCKTTDHVFPSAIKARATLSGMAVSMLMRRMGVGHYTMHGFRSSFMDWCAEHEIAREVAEMAFAHRVGSAVEQAYARSSLLERRRPVMQRWADHLSGQAARTTWWRSSGREGPSVGAFDDPPING
jgi:integrase